jgi:hypothetical protein
MAPTARLVRAVLKESPMKAMTMTVRTTRPQSMKPANLKRKRLPLAVDAVVVVVEEAAVDVALVVEEEVVGVVVVARRADL